MKTAALCTVALALAACGTADRRSGAEYDHAEVWASQVAEYRAQSAPERPMVFIGSSTIRLWQSQGLSHLPVVMRGIGGSTLPQVLWYSEELALRYNPRAVIVYGGSNDIGGASGRPAERVINDLTKVVLNLSKGVPNSRIYVLSLHPAPLRQASWAEFRRFNSMASDSCQSGLCQYIHASRELWQIAESDPEKLPGYYLSDGLHLNEEGYALLAREVRPVLTSAYHNDLFLRH